MKKYRQDEEKYISAKSIGSAEELLQFLKEEKRK